MVSQYRAGLRTPLESTVFGTAIKIGGCSGLLCLGTISVDGSTSSSRHIAKEQKFNALTVKMCRSHGCLLSVVASSMGKILSMDSSSLSVSSQILSLLSLPCLTRTESAPVIFRRRLSAYVIIRSAPQLPIPRIPS